MALVISRGTRGAADNPAQGLPGSVPPGAARSPHPKARMVADNGWYWEFGLAPTAADVGGWSKNWTQIARPGRKPLLVDAGPQLRTLGLQVIARHPYDPLNRTDIEGTLRALRDAAGTSLTFTIERMGVTEEGLWRLTDVKVRPTRRQHGTNYNTRAEVDLSFVEVSGYNVNGYINNTGPVTGGVVTTPTGTTSTPVAVASTSNAAAAAPTSYVVRQGDTLAKISIAMYGTSSRYGDIARASKISNPNRIYPGQRLTVPRP
jgi:LysM repeat protein